MPAESCFLSVGKKEGANANDKDEGQPAGATGAEARQVGPRHQTESMALQACDAEFRLQNTRPSQAGKFEPIYSHPSPTSYCTSHKSLLIPILFPSSTCLGSEVVPVDFALLFFGGPSILRSRPAFSVAACTVRGKPSSSFQVQCESTGRC